MSETGADPAKWIIIPVEVQVRDLMGRLMVANIAASRGYNVLIGHDQVVRRLARWLPKGIMFDKALGAEGDKKANRYCRLGYKLTAFDEESTGFYANPDIPLTGRLSMQTLSLAQRWFTLSDTLRDLVLKKYPGFDDKIVTTGLPRSDIWRPEYHDLYKHETDAITAKHGKYILFCSNFGRVIHGKDQRFIKRQQQRNKQAGAAAQKYRERTFEQSRQNLEAFMEMLPRLREWFPDHKLIIRPHPSENSQYWHEAFSGMNGIEIHEEGTTAPWILASSCLVHHGCTTGIEAELMSKFHVMYAPFPDEHHDTDLMKRFAPVRKNLDDLRQTMTDVIIHGTSLAQSREALSEYYAGLSGKLVAERIVDEFDMIQQRPARLSGLMPLLKWGPRHLFATWWPRSKQDRTYRLKKYRGVSLA